MKYTCLCIVLNYITISVINPQPRPQPLTLPLTLAPPVSARRPLLRESPTCDYFRIWRKTKVVLVKVVS